MNNNLLIKTKEIGNHRIEIYYDTDTGCPCRNWDMAANYLWEYSDVARLSNDCDWREIFGEYGKGKYTLVDALHQLINDYVEWKELLNYFKTGKLNGYRMRYDRSENLWYLEWHDCSRYNENKGYEEILSISPSDLSTYDYMDEFLESLEDEELVQILSDLGKDIFVKVWSTTGYSQGDFVGGIAFCTKERYARMVNTDIANWRIKIDSLIESEVKDIGMWMWGDVKGFVLEKKVYFTKQFQDESHEDEESFEWEEVDSCWGYYMETDELINEVMLEHKIKEVA